MLNEEETDQTGRESLQEPITANGSQLSAQSDASSHRAFSLKKKRERKREMEGGGEREQSWQREREREGDGVEGMEGARVILKGDRGEERLAVEAGDEGRRGGTRDCCCLEMERRRLRESVFHRETNNKSKISK